MEHPKDKRFKDLTGQVFTRLTVLEYAGPAARRQKLWTCICECGEIRIVRSATLVNGMTKSCGCLKRDQTIARNTTHGLRSHPLYPTWNNMMHRCHNPKSGEWKNYGERGIRVSPRWQTFANFAEDMGEKPSPKHSLERKDTNDDYYPGNCKWATDVEQSNNKRTNHFLELNGKRQTIAQWARELGINHEIIRGRIRKNCSDAEALAL